MISLISSMLRNRKAGLLFLIATALGTQATLSAKGTAWPDGSKEQDLSKTATLAFGKVIRGDLVVTIQERGSVAPRDPVPIVCRVRNNEQGIASTIQWLVEEGSSVNKGARLAELDGTDARAHVRAQETVVAEKKARLDQALKERELAAQQAKLELETAEDNVALAEIDCKQAADADKQKSEIRLRQARRAAQLARIQGQARTEKAEAVVAPARAALDAEFAKLVDAKAQLASCTLTAPSDGIVIYNVNIATARFGSGPGTIAIGEPVRQGQVLLTIFDPQHLQVVVRVHEALVRRLRPSGKGTHPARQQQATIQIDAFPRRPLHGYVETVASKAETADFFSSDIKLFPATIALRAGQDLNGLKPGMSGLVTVLVDERKNVLTVPIQAVRVLRGNRICYVKAGDGIEPRSVVLGQTNESLAEVSQGLKEGEEVVLNPQALQAPRRSPAGSQSRRRPLGMTDVVVRSLRPDEEASARIERYGVTFADVARLEETIPGVALAAPTRRLIRSFRRPSSPDVGITNSVVATTAAYGLIQGFAHLLEDGHRFITDLDQEQAASVAVLTPEAAHNLFPGEDPLGQTVLVSGHPFRVVGVLRERPPSAVALNEDAYIPLASLRQRFGQQIAVRLPGSFRREEVELTEVFLVLRDRSQSVVAAAAVRGLFEHFHAKPDWQVINTSW